MTETRSRYLHYLLQWGAAMLAALLFAAGFNYAIDPYGLFDSARISGFNDIKPSASSHVRLAKPYQVSRFSPKAVIGGTSRPEMGLDPSNDCWPDEYKPVFNMALPGSSIYMQARVLQHAIAEGGVRYVLWGLDFIDFLGRQADLENGSRWPPGFQEFERRLKINADGGTNSGYPYRKIVDYYQGMFSLDTLKDSLKTVASQGQRLSSTINRDGFNPALDYHEIIRWEGQGVLFEQKNSELDRMLGRRDMMLHDPAGAWPVQYESVRQLLKYADNNGVDVKLFINPYHSDYLLAIDRAKRWDEFERWKKQLVKLTEEFRVDLWDFSVINELSMEPAPVPEDKESVLQWFWEPAHYRAEYGELMLEKMLQNPCGRAGVAVTGGVINSRNIDMHLDRTRSDFLRFKGEQKVGGVMLDE